MQVGAYYPWCVINILILADQQTQNHAEKAIKHHEPSIVATIKKCNEMHNRMLDMKLNGWVSNQAVVPPELELKGLFDLNIDADIWVHFGNNSNEWPDHAPPLWLADPNIRKNILAQETMKYHQGIEWCKVECSNIQSWFMEEYCVVLIRQKAIFYKDKWNSPLFVMVMPLSNHLFSHQISQWSYILKPSHALNGSLRVKRIVSTSMSVAHKWFWMHCPCSITVIMVNSGSFFLIHWIYMMPQRAPDQFIGTLSNHLWMFMEPWSLLQRSLWRNIWNVWVPSGRYLHAVTWDFQIFMRCIWPSWEIGAFYCHAGTLTSGH